jgi:hypothetical protein
MKNKMINQIQHFILYTSADGKVNVDDFAFGAGQDFLKMA